MECLAGRDEIDGVRGQSCGFRGTRDAGEVRINAQEFFARRTHFGVGLDSQDTIAEIQEQFAEQAGAGADVGDGVLDAKVAPGFQQRQNFLRIAGTVANVVRHAVGKALFGVGESHERFLVISFQFLVNPIQI